MILDCHKKPTAPKELVSIELLFFTKKIAALHEIQSTKENFQILSTVRNYDAFLAWRQYHTLLLQWLIPNSIDRWFPWSPNPEFIILLLVCKWWYWKWKPHMICIWKVHLMHHCPLNPSSVGKNMMASWPWIHKHAAQSYQYYMKMDVHMVRLILQQIIIR